MTKSQLIVNLLESAGDNGMTVYQLIVKGGGNDVRKRISDLRRKGVDITDKWERAGKSRFKRYFITENWYL